MIRITCYIKPHRLEPVKAAVAALGISGLSVSDVRGTGNSPESTDLLAGNGIVALPIRAKMEVVVADGQAEEVAEAVRHSAWTGDADDGKIFLEKVIDAVRVRTLERGETAI